MTQGFDEMKSDTAITWNWFRVNVPTIVAIAGAVLFMNTWMNKQEARLDDMERYRETRSKLTDNNFAMINARMEPLANIPYRVAQTETAIQATNQRLDRLAETIVSSLDLIRKDVNGLSTRVEVLSNKIDAITPSRQSMLEQMPQAPPGR